MVLYHEYEKKFLINNEIDIQDDGTKRDIELYDRGQVLHLPGESLQQIQILLDDYNDLTRNSYKLRYYQVLALFFTEEFLRDQIQTSSSLLNDRKEKQRMLAYWMATGSGKTLVMHLNILQYLHHFCQNDNLRLQIFLTTPLANLIKQHERELEPYIRALNESYNNRIELIIDTTQGLLQKDEDYFELPDNSVDRRLVLVDEAHIGLTSSEASKFKELRTRLNVSESFLFEYSATFHNLAKELRDEYENTIIYRYDYARFYSDGYGKDHYFKPISADKVTDESDEEIKDNLNECLRVMEEKLGTFNRIQNDEQFDSDLTAHRPLLAFMGHTVEKPKDEGKDDEVSDIQKVLDFFAALGIEERQKFRHIFRNHIIGPLVVARNPENSNELLLSYGEGEKWGMINVGDATSFYNNISNDLIETRDENIGDPKLQFENLDNESSPINILIGSRKFAEGWNSYRLSVIDLINLGSSRGNLIIQIFGRGVRLKGKGGDGKRRYLEHYNDYNLLRKNDKEGDIRRLETLTVFSLRRSYLERFLEEVRKGGVRLQHAFKIPVNPMFFKVDTNTEVNFNQYSEKLHIFRQGDTADKGIIRIVLNKREIHYSYYENENEKAGTIENWRKLTLDYRTDKNKETLDVYKDLCINNDKYYRYLNRAKLAAVISQESEKNQVQMYNKENYKPTIGDFLSLVGEILYREQDHDPIAWTDQLNRQIVIDATRKLKNRINAHINRSNYIYRTLERDDFIYEYTVTKEFQTQDEFNAFMEEIENAELNELQVDPCKLLENRLKLWIRNHRHIYEPLMCPIEDVENEYQDVKLSPDRLNVGEKKFVEDFTDFIKQKNKNKERYEFYLMRNVQKIGIYLESDAGSYYPDFVLWVLDSQKHITHLIFIDPKGEREIIGGVRGDYKSHPKVTIAQKLEDNTLIYLEEKLESEHSRMFSINSFILLRDRSELGKEQPNEWVKENMIDYNILRLDWHDKREDGSTSQLFADEKSYLDLMFEKVGIELYQD